MTRKTAFIGLRAMGGPMASNTVRSPGSIHVVEIVGAQLAPSSRPAASIAPPRLHEK